MDLSSDDPTKMYFYENRLQTFVGWPFEEGCICTPENVSEPFDPANPDICFLYVLQTEMRAFLYYRWPKLDLFTPRQRIVQI